MHAICNVALGLDKLSGAIAMNCRQVAKRRRNPKPDRIARGREPAWHDPLLRKDGEKLGSAPETAGREMINFLSVGVVSGMDLAGCAEGPALCETDVVQSGTAAEGIYDAVLFHRDCGVATGFSSQESIIARLPAMKNSADTGFFLWRSQ